MFPRNGHTRGMDDVRLDPTRLKPARQPKAVAAGLESNRNARDSAAGPDRLIPPAMQHGKQPFWARLQLLARLTFYAGKHAGNEAARLAHLDDGYDRAILVQGDEGSAQSLPRRRPGSFGWGIAALHRLNAATKLPFPRRPPHSVSRSPTRSTPLRDCAFRVSGSSRPSGLDPAKIAGFAVPILVAAEPGEAHGGAQFPKPGPLLLGDAQGFAIQHLGGLGLPLARQQLAFV